MAKRDAGRALGEQRHRHGVVPLPSAMSQSTRPKPTAATPRTPADRLPPVATPPSHGAQLRPGREDDPDDREDDPDQLQRRRAVPLTSPITTGTITPDAAIGSTTPMVPTASAA